ncbi:MAG: type II secretion system F family protein [Candidatus Pacearchaeota archaeon]
MTLELLKQNIARKKEIIESILILNEKLENLPKNSIERRDIENSIDLKVSQLKILNNAIPSILANINFYKPLGETKPKQNVMAISYTIDTGERKIAAIKNSDEKKFIEKVGISEYDAKKSSKTMKADIGFNFYARISNKIFKNIANGLIEKGYFDSIKMDLRKIASPIIISSYVSMMFFSSFVMFLIGLIIGFAVIFLLKNLSFGFLIIFFFPIITFGIFLLYPSSQRKNLEKEINNELPFLTIYMGAIATSGIEPSKIFDILVKSEDYPFTQREIKKLTNYINFYGYDLVSALRSVSKTCPSERLSQLFDGLATTITSGGELPEFLNKHAETLLFDYRLEREKYTHLAETFMNIYISVVIAAPMILMILFILMSVSGFGAGFLTAEKLGILTMLVVGMLNVGFLILLNAKQPKF